MIVVSDKAASTNVSLFLCNSIRENAWSITDTIEFIDYSKSSSDLNQKMAKLVEHEYYLCDKIVHQSFYNY